MMRCSLFNTVLKSGLAISLIFCFVIHNAFAEYDAELEVGAQYRYFFDSGFNHLDQANPSLSLTSGVEYFFTDNVRFKTRVHARYDEQDKQRTRADVAEAYVFAVHDNWELKLGYDQIFWGRAEVLNVVDVINQRDQVEGDKDAKLGQPMLNINYQLGSHQLELYSLFGVRKRPFPGSQGRLSTTLPVDNNAASYVGTKKNNLEFAMRFSGPVSDSVDIGVSYFNGTERAPYFNFNYDFNDPKLVPVYAGVEQLGVELEYIRNNLAVKLEAVRKNDTFYNYWASVFSAEYNFSGFMGSPADLTLVTEYLWDQRAKAAPSFFENDIAIAARVAFNDSQSTNVILSTIIDDDNSEQIYLFDLERRITDNLAMRFSAQVFDGSREPNYQNSVIDLAQNLLDNELIIGDVSIDQILNAAGQIADNNNVNFFSCLLDIAACVNTLNNDAGVVHTLQALQKNSFAASKLTFLEDEDFVQLDFSYSF